jgi:glycosyltransferase involved in cell wall biosynthesis
LCSSHNENHVKPFRKFAEKLGVQHQLIWKYQLDKPELRQILQHALLSVAPLTECSRNIEQSCSPLKIFESMASGVPVVGSDLPVVREIISPDKDGMLVRAGRPAELARAIRIAVDYPEFRKQLGERALQTIQDRFTWAAIQEKLRHTYENIFSYSYHN